MAQNEKQLKPATVFTDMGLTLVAVAVVAVTFWGVSGLTPRLYQKDTSEVLGVSTRKEALSFFPANVSQLPFISNLTISDTTGMTNNSTALITFKPLEATTYRFDLLTIRNTSVDYKKIQLTPSFSLGNSYTTISIIFAGKETEIVSGQGTITPLDLGLPPNSSSGFELVVQPTSPLATPVTLTLSFTELP